MDISKDYIRTIFNRADANQDSKIDSAELNTFVGSDAEKNILHSGFAEAQINGYDQDTVTMSLPDYMTAMNVLKNQIGITELYTEHEIQWSDREYVLAALRQAYDSNVLQYVETSLWSDRDFVLTIVRESSYALRYADPVLQADREVVMASRNLEYADPVLRADRDFVLAMIRINDLSFRYADPILQADKGVIIEAIKRYPGIFSAVPPFLKSDKQFVLELIKYEPRILEFLDPLLKQDRDVVLFAIRNYYPVLESIPDSIFDYDFKQNLVIYGSWKFKLDSSKYLKYWESSNRLQNALSGLTSLNIFKYERLRNAEDAEKIILWRTQIKNKTFDASKPTVLIVFPKDDGGRGGFNDSDNVVSQFLDQGYQVIYYEAGTEVDLYEAIEDVGQAWPIQNMIIGGHGFSQGLTFDESVGPITGLIVYLDVWDEKEIIDFGLSRYFAPNSKIILASCLVGSGGAGANNLANMLKRVFPETNIYSSITSTTTPYFEFDEHGNIINLERIYGEATYIPLTGEVTK